MSKPTSFVNNLNRSVSFPFDAQSYIESGLTVPLTPDDCTWPFELSSSSLSPVFSSDNEDFDSASIYADVPSLSSSRRSSGASEDQTPRPQRHHHKAASSGSVQSSDFGRHGKRRTAHNLVERKYRNTINVEMERLRQAVPFINSFDSNAVNGRPKSSKAIVLASAVQYIRKLEEENRELSLKNKDMRATLIRASAGWHRSN
jgi:hypothetical protein